MRLSAQQLDAFGRHGWLHLPGALDPQLLALLQGWADDLQAWSEVGSPGLHHFEQTVNGPAVARTEHVADDHQELGDFIRQGLVVDVLAQLFGEPAVLFKEKINYKHPGGAGFAPHQDATAYRFVDHHISVMVPLDASTMASGCLYLADGHTLGALPTDHRGRVRADVASTLDWQAVEAQPGDLLVFDSYAPHYSETNHTDASRRALYLTYNAASAGDFRATYYADKLAEFDTADGTFGSERVRMSINDDFLGVPVEAP